MNTAADARRRQFAEVVALAVNAHAEQRPCDRIARVVRRAAGRACRILAVVVPLRLGLGDTVGPARPQTVEPIVAAGIGHHRGAGRIASGVEQL